MKITLLIYYFRKRRYIDGKKEGNKKNCEEKTS